jgi:hypothetical protein
MRINLTPKQIHMIEDSTYHGIDAAGCVLLDDSELTRIGLDVPAGTVELRQGDEYMTISPWGEMIEDGAGANTRDEPYGPPPVPATGGIEHDAEGNLTNASRASFGRAAVEAGTPDTYGDDDKDTAVIDTLANLMHYCGAHGIDFDAAERSASMHFNAEATGIEDETLMPVREVKLRNQIRAVLESGGIHQNCSDRYMVSHIALEAVAQWLDIDYVGRGEGDVNLGDWIDGGDES